MNPINIKPRRIITLAEFQAANSERNYTPHWDLPRWGNALAGEVGEACNVIKKIDRDGKSDGLVKMLGAELGDVLAYACLTADSAGLNLWQESIAKFNVVCLRIGRHDLMLEAG